MEDDNVSGIQNIKAKWHATSSNTDIEMHKFIQKRKHIGMKKKGKPTTTETTEMHTYTFQIPTN